MTDETREQIKRDAEAETSHHARLSDIKAHPDFWSKAGTSEGTNDDVLSLGQNAKPAKDQVIKDLRAQLAAAEKRCKELDSLKQVTIDYLRKQDDKPFMASSSGAFTTHQLANEIMDGTDTGINCINGLILLAADLISRGKETISTPL